MTPSADGYEYFRHRDGDFYRRPESWGRWETSLELDADEWKTIRVPLSNQDWDHLYPMDPDEVEAAPRTKDRRRPSRPPDSSSMPKLGSEERFPPEDVEACHSDQVLQRKHSYAELNLELKREMGARRKEVVQAGASKATRWIYFSSPSSTWEHLCGSAGWLLYDPQSRHQHDFILTLMN